MEVLSVKRCNPTPPLYYRRPGQANRSQGHRWERRCIRGAFTTVSCDRGSSTLLETRSCRRDGRTARSTLGVSTLWTRVHTWLLSTWHGSVSLQT